MAVVGKNLPEGVDEAGVLQGGRTPDPEAQDKCMVVVVRNVDVQFAVESSEDSNMWLQEVGASPVGILWVLVVAMAVRQPSQVEEVVLPLHWRVAAAVLTHEIFLELELSLLVQAALEEYAHESEKVESEVVA